MSGSYPVGAASVGDVHTEVGYSAIAHFFVQGKAGARGLQNGRLDARVLLDSLDHLPHDCLRETQPTVLWKRRHRVHSDYVSGDSGCCGGNGASIHVADVSLQCALPSNLGAVHRGAYGIRNLKTKRHDFRESCASGI